MTDTARLGDSGRWTFRNKTHHPNKRGQNGPEQQRIQIQDVEPDRSDLSQ